MMNRHFRTVAGAGLAVLLSLSGTEGASAQSLDRLPAPTAGSGDPCTFFHGQAFGKGLYHVNSEMLWACREIARRRAAGMSLSLNLLEADQALQRYRAAHAAASARGFTERRRLGQRRFGLEPEEVETIVAEAGVLAALERISTGF